MAFTYRNVKMAELSFTEADQNFAEVERLHDEALEARDVAVADTIIYPDTTAGLAATADGGYFVVPDTGTDELVYYREETGVAVEKVRIGYRLPYSGGTLTAALNEAPPVTIASAATVNIGAAAANTVIVSGTATITAFDTIAAGAIRYIRATGAFTLTHNATSLILPGGANIVAAAGDVFRFESLGSGNWRMTGFQSGAFGKPQPLDATLTSLSALGTAADKMAYTTGVDTWAEAAITAAGRALLDDADAAAQLATLGTTAFNTFVSADQTITLAGALTLAHGLGTAPRAAKLALVCQTAELGYSVGDVLMDISARTIASISVDATNLNIRFMDSANVLITNKSTGARSMFAVANWKARFFAIK